MQRGGLVVCLLSVHTRLGTLSLFEIIVYALSVKLEERAVRRFFWFCLLTACPVVGSVSYCLMLDVDGELLLYTFHSSASKAGY